MTLSFPDMALTGRTDCDLCVRPDDVDDVMDSSWPEDDVEDLSCFPLTSYSLEEERRPGKKYITLMMA